MKTLTIDGKEEFKKNWLILNDCRAVIMPPQAPPTITFLGAEGKDVLRLEANGEIYINGVLAKNDKEVVDGLVEFVNEGHKWKRKCEALELEVEALKEYKFKYEGLDK